MGFEMPKMLAKTDLDPEIERVVHEIIGAAIEVHKELGPGLLEGIYEDALVVELRMRGLAVDRQVSTPIFYKGQRVRDQRLDVLVARCVIVELKAAKAVSDGEKAQLRSYLRAAGLPIGLIFNFHEPLLKDGLYRIFNERAIGFRMPPIKVSTSTPSRPASSLRGEVSL